MIISPYRQPPGFDQEAPTAEFAVGLRELCDRHGALLIHDEVRTGMRLELGSAWRRFGVAPDLSAWGKAIANGYALAALVGKEEVREAARQSLRHRLLLVDRRRDGGRSGDARDDGARGLARRDAATGEPGSSEGLAGRRRGAWPRDRGQRTADDALRPLRRRWRRSRPQRHLHGRRAGSTGCTSTHGTTGSSRRQWTSVTLTRRSPRSRLESMQSHRKRTSVDPWVTATPNPEYQCLLRRRRR